MHLVMALSAATPNMPAGSRGWGAPVPSSFCPSAPQQKSGKLDGTKGETTNCVPCPRKFCVATHYSGVCECLVGQAPTERNQVTVADPSTRMCMDMTSRSHDKVFDKA